MLGFSNFSKLVCLGTASLVLTGKLGQFLEEGNCLTSAPCNVSAAGTVTITNKMMYYHCQRKMLYWPRCFLLLWDMLLLLMRAPGVCCQGVCWEAVCIPPPCKRTPFLLWYVLSWVLYIFLLIRLFASVTLVFPGWLVWLLLKKSFP